MENKKQEDLYVKEVLNINMLKELLGVNLFEYEDTIWGSEITQDQEEIVARILEFITKKLILSGANSREMCIREYLSNISTLDITKILEGGFIYDCRG